MSVRELQLLKASPRISLIVAGITTFLRYLQFWNARISIDLIDAGRYSSSMKLLRNAPSSITIMLGENETSVKRQSSKAYCDIDANLHCSLKKSFCMCDCRNALLPNVSRLSGKAKSLRYPNQYEHAPLPIDCMLLGRFMDLMLIRPESAFPSIFFRVEGRLRVSIRAQ